MIINQTPVQSCIFLRTAEKKKKSGKLCLFVRWWDTSDTSETSVYVIVSLIIQASINLSWQLHSNFQQETPRCATLCIRLGEMDANNAKCMSWNVTFHLEFPARLFCSVAQPGSMLLHMLSTSAEAAHPMLPLPVKIKKKEAKKGESPFLHLLVLNDVITFSRSKTMLVESARACDMQQILLHWALLHIL